MRAVEPLVRPEENLAAAERDGLQVWGEPLALLGGEGGEELVFSRNV